MLPYMVGDETYNDVAEVVGDCTQVMNMTALFGQLIHPEKKTRIIFVHKNVKHDFPKIQSLKITSPFSLNFRK